MREYTVVNKYYDPTFIKLLYPFWKMKALIPIHCNCMENVFFHTCFEQREGL